MGSPDSVSVLTDVTYGWPSQNAVSELTIKGNNEGPDYIFEQLYVCDTAISHYGYTFWGEGTRHIKKEGLRDLFTKVTKALAPLLACHQSFLRVPP